MTKRRIVLDEEQFRKPQEHKNVPIFSGEYYVQAPDGSYQVLGKARDVFAQQERARLCAHGIAGHNVENVCVHVMDWTEYGRTSTFAIPPIPEDFALRPPEVNAPMLPVHTKYHVRAAIARFPEYTALLSHGVRTVAARRIAAAAGRLGIDLPDSFEERYLR